MFVDRSEAVDILVPIKNASRVTREAGGNVVAPPNDERYSGNLAACSRRGLIWNA
jgi:hypothetical protein